MPNDMRLLFLLPNYKYGLTPIPTVVVDADVDDPNESLFSCCCYYCCCEHTFLLSLLLAPAFVSIGANMI